jgi:hypothetical protein
MNCGRDVPDHASAHLRRPVIDLSSGCGVGRLDLGAASLETGDQEVPECEGRAATKNRGLDALPAFVPIRIATQREVVELRTRARQRVVVEFVVIRFDALVGIVASLRDGDELRPPTIAERPIEAVVRRVG